MYKNRIIESTLKEALTTFPVVIITGPRQCGKTTLVKHVLGDEFSYVSIDEMDNRMFAREDPRGFLARYSRPLIIDEIQNAPELLTYIKAEVDKNRVPGQWVLTGSQQFSLMRHVSESLAGRASILDMFTFNYSEVNGTIVNNVFNPIDYLNELCKKNSNKSNYTIDDFLFRGGFPELSINEKVSPRLWFSSYMQTYIDRDLRGNIKDANLHDFERFVKLLAARTAMQINYSSLAKEIGVTVPTIKSWISFMEASSLVYLLYPYHKNYGKRIIKSPKCYFTDTGLVSFLVGLHEPEHLISGPMAGAFFETACVNEFLKRFKSCVYSGNLYYWRSTDGLEVDLIIETNTKLIPIEFKLNSTITPNHITPLKKWMSMQDKQVDKGYVVSTASQSGLLSENIFNISFASL